MSGMPILNRFMTGLKHAKNLNGKSLKEAILASLRQELNRTHDDAVKCRCKLLNLEKQTRWGILDEARVKALTEQLAKKTQEAHRLQSRIDILDGSLRGLKVENKQLEAYLEVWVPKISDQEDFSFRRPLRSKL